jgi:hypothetical protein
LNIFGRGSVKSSLSEVSSDYEDSTSTQSSGVGSKLSMDFEYKLSGWSLYAELFYRTWDIDDSDTDFQVVDGEGRYFYEPKNSTKMAGLMLGGRF